MVAYPIIYRLVPIPFRFEIRQWIKIREAPSALSGWFSWRSYILVELQFGDVAFLCTPENRRNRRKTFREVKINNKLYPHIPCTHLTDTGNRARKTSGTQGNPHMAQGQIGWRRALSPLRHPSSPWMTTVTRWSLRDHILKIITFNIH